MFLWLAALPMGWQIAIVILLIVSFVVIALRGKMSVWYGKARIGLGNGGSKDSCEKYLTTIRTEERRTNRRVYRIEYNNLKSKMNFAEQKLLIIKRIIFLAYMNTLHKKSEGSGLDPNVEEKESNLFESRLKNALDLMGDEIRRAFKENGFQDKGDNELDEYINGESEVLINIYEDYIANNYPKGMFVSKIELNDIVKSSQEKICQHFNEVFRKAKRIEITSIKEINRIEQENDDRISNLTQRR